MFESFESYETNFLSIFYHFFQLTRFFVLAVPSSGEHLSFFSLNITTHTHTHIATNRKGYMVESASLYVGSL